MSIFLKLLDIIKSLICSEVNKKNVIPSQINMYIIV